MLVVFLWSVVLKYFVWSSHYVRIMLKVIVRNFWATVYDCGHLTGEDDFSAILGYRLLGLIFERY